MSTFKDVGIRKKETPYLKQLVRVCMYGQKDKQKGHVEGLIDNYHYVEAS